MLLARPCIYLLLILALSVDARDPSGDGSVIVAPRSPKASRKRRVLRSRRRAPTVEEETPEPPPVTISLGEQDLVVPTSEDGGGQPVKIEGNTTEEPPPQVPESEAPKIEETVATEITEEPKTIPENEVPPLSEGGPPPPPSPQSGPPPPPPPPKGPPLPGGVPVSVKPRNPELKMKRNLNCRTLPKKKRPELKETIYSDHVARLEEWEGRRDKLSKQLEKAKKGTDKKEAERLQKEIDSITLLPSEQAERFKTLFTVPALTKEQKQELAKKNQAKKSGEKVGLGTDPKTLMNLSLLVRGAKSQLYKGSETKSYRTPAEIPNDEVAGALLSMASSFDGFEGLKKLVPEQETCDAANKLPPEQRTKLVEAEDLMFQLCQGGRTNFEASIKFQTSIAGLPETFNRLREQSDACLETARTILSSEALKAVITEATAIVAHSVDQFSKRPITLDYLNLIDLIEMKKIKGVDGKRTLMQEALENVKPELLEKLVKEFSVSVKAASGECTSLGSTFKKAEAKLVKLRNRLELAINNEDEYKTVAEMDLNLGIMARKDLLTSLEIQVPDIKNSIQQFEEVFKRVVKYLGEQPILCPPAETISAVQALGGKLEEVCTKIYEDLMSQVKPCDPGTERTTVLHKILEFLVNAAEEQNKARLDQLEREEKIKARETKAKEREAKLNEQREKRQAKAEERARQRLQKKIKSGQKVKKKGANVHTDEV